MKVSLREWRRRVTWSHETSKLRDRGMPKHLVGDIDNGHGHIWSLCTSLLTLRKMSVMEYANRLVILILGVGRLKRS